MDNYPTVPETAIPDDWERRDRSEDALFDAGAASVVGRTVLYVDATIEAVLAEAGLDGVDESSADRDDRLVGVDTVAPFAFATALSVRPPLAPGIGPASVYPMVLAEARRSLAGDLRARGFEAVEYDRDGRVRTESGDRARLTRYGARYPLDDDVPADALTVEGWLAVWTWSGSFLVAGGVYPTNLDAVLGGGADSRTVDPSTLRTVLIDLIRAVE